MKQYNLDEFEFSQAYLFFWDKVRLLRHVSLMERHAVCALISLPLLFSSYR